MACKHEHFLSRWHFEQLEVWQAAGHAECPCQTLCGGFCISSGVHLPDLKPLKFGQGPSLPSPTRQVSLSVLSSDLFLHHVGLRSCLRRTPNFTKGELLQAALGRSRGRANPSHEAASAADEFSTALRERGRRTGEVPGGLLYPFNSAQRKETAPAFLIPPSPPKRSCL